jgi:hypothetical protein
MGSVTLATGCITGKQLLGGVAKGTGKGWVLSNRLCTWEQLLDGLLRPQEELGTSHQAWRDCRIEASQESKQTSKSKGLRVAVSVVKKC